MNSLPQTPASVNRKALVSEANQLCNELGRCLITASLAGPGPYAMRLLYLQEMAQRRFYRRLYWDEPLLYAAATGKLGTTDQIPYADATGFTVAAIEAQAAADLAAMSPAPTLPRCDRARGKEAKSYGVYVACADAVDAELCRALLS